MADNDKPDMDPKKLFMTQLSMLVNQAFKAGLGVYDIVGLMEMFKTTLVTKSIFENISEFKEELKQHKNN
jgi:hypothetical protein